MVYGTLGSTGGGMRCLLTLWGAWGVFGAVLCVEESLVVFVAVLDERLRIWDALGLSLAMCLWCGAGFQLQSAPLLNHQLVYESKQG